MYLGSMAGSILGGRWSDYSLRRLKAENGGVGSPEVYCQYAHIKGCY